MTFTLPRWYLKEKFSPSGQRLFKKPKVVVQRELPSVYQRPTLITVFTPGKVGPKHFDGTEYRYWAAAPLEENRENDIYVSECRACGSMFTTKEDRRDHHSKMGCTKKLVAAYKLLLRDNKCVICDKVTTKEKFGVPLCGDACISLWCGEISKPEALRLALELVGY